MSYNVKIEDLTFNFAKRIVFLRKKLVSAVDKEYVISKQILRSCTSIGANIAEAEHPQSTADYLKGTSINSPFK
ncbi:MAG: four helix bundle protein [Bacteroidales bacterium]|nr:four helix bundle protein [Bacteroidales bacterium]